MSFTISRSQWKLIDKPFKNKFAFDPLPNEKKEISFPRSEAPKCTLIHVYSGCNVYLLANPKANGTRLKYLVIPGSREDPCWFGRARIPPVFPDLHLSIRAILTEWKSATIKRVFVLLPPTLGQYTWSTWPKVQRWSGLLEGGTTCKPIEP